MHDEEIWIAFTEQIVLGDGRRSRVGRAPARTDMVREWERHENFSLYEDAFPVLDELRRRGLKIGLISNGQRDLEEFAEHHPLDVDAVVGSKAHGRVKPHASIFVAALQALERRPRTRRRWSATRTRTTSRARARSGSARSCSTGTGCSRDAPDRIDTLLALPAALGLGRVQP